MLKFALIFLTAFRVAFVGDPQVGNEKELEYARKSIYKELRQRSDLDLVVVLGDLVNKNPSLVAPSQASLDSLPCPWVRVNGNHDPAMECRDSCLSYGKLHFILMNNVRHAKRGYEGGFVNSQKEWLDSVMRTIPFTDRIVLCTHIPLSASHGKDSLYNIVSGHNSLLAMCGHTHYVRRHILEGGIEEVLAGASCGSWWRGVKDADGIPYSLMNCGAPRGYFVADFKSSGGARRWYSLSYKAVGREDIASVHIRDGKIVVNIFGGSSEGSLKIRYGGKWYDLRRQYTMAPEVSDVIAHNVSKPRSYKSTHKDEFIPAMKSPSSHVWVGDLKDLALPEDIVNVRVKYWDPHMSFLTTLVCQR